VCVCVLLLHSVVEQDYIHKVPVIWHDKLQRKPHKPDAPPSSVTSAIKCQLNRAILLCDVITDGKLSKLRSFDRK